MISTKRRGTSGLICSARVGARFRIASKVSPDVFAANAQRPVAIS